MPMKIESDFGTRADGSIDRDYCTYCRQKGEFTKPDITMKQMIEGCVGIMVQYGVEEGRARTQMAALIPTLKRWK